MTTKMFHEMSDAEKLAFEAYIDAHGVYRWKSNNSVPPADILERAGIDAGVRAKCTAARDAELAAFLAEYRANYKGPSAEERAEMRAAFGEGATIVNVITGTKIRL